MQKNNPETSLSASDKFRSVESRSSVDYLLRTQQQNNVHLIQIADQKANILISLTAIVLTLILTRYELTQMPLSLMVLAAGLVLSALIAMITLFPRSVRKSRNSGSLDPNLLSYVDASRLSPESYCSQMALMLNDDGELYFQLTRDLHNQARILNRKYFYLRASYIALAFAVVAALVAGLQPV